MIKKYLRNKKKIESKLRMLWIYGLCREEKRQNVAM